MILPWDPLVVPQPGFRSDFVGWSDGPIRPDPIEPGIGFIDMGILLFLWNT
jgi:hypothetical protein